MKRFLFSFALIVLACFTWAEEKPDLLVIMVDDPGYGDRGPGYWKNF